MTIEIIRFQRINAKYDQKKQIYVGGDIIKSPPICVDPVSHRVCKNNYNIFCNCNVFCGDTTKPNLFN